MKFIVDLITIRWGKFDVTPILDKNIGAFSDFLTVNFSIVALVYLSHIFLAGDSEITKILIIAHISFLSVALQIFLPKIIRIFSMENKYKNRKKIVTSLVYLIIFFGPYLIIRNVYINPSPLTDYNSFLKIIFLILYANITVLIIASLINNVPAINTLCVSMTLLVIITINPATTAYIFLNISGKLPCVKIEPNRETTSNFIGVLLYQDELNLMISNKIEAYKIQDGTLMTNKIMGITRNQNYQLSRAIDDGTFFNKTCRQLYIQQ